VETAERGIPRFGQLLRRLQDSLEHHIEVELRENAADNVEDRSRRATRQRQAEYGRAVILTGFRAQNRPPTSAASLHGATLKTPYPWDQYLTATAACHPSGAYQPAPRQRVAAPPVYRVARGLRPRNLESHESRPMAGRSNNR